MFIDSCRRSAASTPHTRRTALTLRCATAATTTPSPHMLPRHRPRRTVQESRPLSFWSRVTWRRGPRASSRRSDTRCCCRMGPSRVARSWRACCWRSGRRPSRLRSASGPPSCAVGSPRRTCFCEPRWPLWRDIRMAAAKPCLTWRPRSSRPWHGCAAAKLTLTPQL
jgi:hypothetical protein